jgi:hypothetical protein
VEGDTSGPTGGEVPNAGGAPGGFSAVFGDLLRHPAAAPSKASDECVRNFLRDFDISPPNRIVDRPSHPTRFSHPNCSQFALAFK